MIEDNTKDIDNKFMKKAMEQARKAEKKGEVPIGAVIVKDGRIISSAFNSREHTQNALNHAEVLVIKKACKRLGSWRLDGCEMYVTLQPCLMCAGAILNSRIIRVIIGTLSDRTNDIQIYLDNNLNWKTKVTILDSADCSQILKDFFAKARKG